MEHKKSLLLKPLLLLVLVADELDSASYFVLVALTIKKVDGKWIIDEIDELL